MGLPATDSSPPPDETEDARRGEGVVVAAVDLGSNSFHLLIARDDHGQLQVIDKLREPVRLAAGLHGGYLSDEAHQRALHCLERFGQRLRDLPSSHVRAVGTNTLRQARDADELVERAERALGHPIEIIPGREEARLIYLGAAHDLADVSARRLVVDIGGGSTECVIGERVEPIETDSLYMGCVSWSERYFPDGELTRDRMKDAIIGARLELQSIERRYRELGWMEAVGTSGTVNAVEGMLRASGWSTEGITAKGLKKLRKAIVAAGKVGALSLPGLAPDRKPVIAGGVAILCGVFESLGVQRMIASAGALREGLAYDLLGRIHHKDVRDRSVARLLERYVLDRDQAARVERTATHLFEQAAPQWELDGEDRHMLSWAAGLHEMGIAVAYSGYHKHGAYLVTYSDLPGFSREDRVQLASLVRAHRRKIRRSYFSSLGDDKARHTAHLAVLLRLAVLLNRSRSPSPLPDIELAADDRSARLRFPEQWLDNHPLTRADLEVEAGYLKKGIGLELRFE